MSGLDIRPADPEDAAVVHAMLRALAEHVGDSEKFANTLEKVRRDAFGPEARYETYLAELDGRPAGLAAIFMTYSTFTGRPCLFVDSLYVEDWARGADVGRQLMALACRLACARDCVRVDLNVHHDNPAQHFYQTLGMAATGEQPYQIKGEAMQALAKLSAAVAWDL